MTIFNVFFVERVLIECLEIDFHLLIYLDNENKQGRDMQETNRWFIIHRYEEEIKSLSNLLISIILF